MKIAKYVVALMLALPALAHAQNTPKPIKLWANDTLKSKISVYKATAEKATGMAVVVCPGGSYAFVSMGNEGDPVGKWFAENGITAVVLNYRLPEGERTRPLDDAREALRYIRRNAEVLHVNPSNVGIWGSSAGGHLASTISTHYVDSLSHPNFTVLYYPVISSRSDLRHDRSFKNLLGEQATKTDYADYSNELQVEGNTPPTLMILSDDDPTVNPLNSIAYYEALKRYNIPAAMYVFPMGKHGYGFKEEWPYQSISRELILRWLTVDK